MDMQIASWRPAMFALTAALEHATRLMPGSIGDSIDSQYHRETSRVLRAPGSPSVTTTHYTGDKPDCDERIRKLQIMKPYVVVIPGMCTVSGAT
jgi:hypothetical protein